MKLYWFSEMPHHVFDEGEDLKYPAMRLEMPNTYFDREVAAHQLPPLLRRARPGRRGRLRRADDQRAPQHAVMLGRLDHDVGGDPGPPDEAGEDRADGQHPADPGQPDHGRRADRDGRPDLRRADHQRLRARHRRRDLVGEREPGPQPRALRGVPRPDHQVLDRAGAVPLGGEALPLPARQPLVPAAPEAAPADLGARARPAPRRRSGPAGRATPTCRSWCRSRSPASCSSSTARGRPRPAARSRRTSSGFLLCAVAADTKREGAARPAASSSGGWVRPPVVRSSTSRRPGIRSRAGQRMALRTRPPNMLTMSYEEKVANDLIVAGDAGVPGGAVRVLPRASSGSGTCCCRATSRRWTTRRRCARSS